jgi:hypothetical protein
MTCRVDQSIFRATAIKCSAFACDFETGFIFTSKSVFTPDIVAIISVYIERPREYAALRIACRATATLPRQFPIFCSELLTMLVHPGVSTSRSAVATLFDRYRIVDVVSVDAIDSLLTVDCVIGIEFLIDRRYVDIVHLSTYTHDVLMRILYMYLVQAKQECSLDFVRKLIRHDRSSSMAPQKLDNSSYAQEYRPGSLASKIYQAASATNCPAIIQLVIESRLNYQA